MSSTTDPPLIRQPPGRRRSSALAPVTEDGGDSCRICRGEATPEQPLFYPCKCSGSIKYVHQDCLMEWLAHSQKKYCELCKTPFRFTKLYDQSMPENVPWLLFMRQAFIHSLRSIGTWTRYSIVTFIWLCWLPWTIRQIWRALFWIADGSWLSQKDLEALLKGYAVQTQLANESAPSLVEAATNSTAGDIEVNFSLFGVIFAILGLLNPQMVLRAVLETAFQTAIWPVTPGEPFTWNTTLLSSPIERPHSLLSDFKSITSATRFPILNNALADVLEGQMICLTIIAAFILVFLIREWVINQQPLLNIPEEDQADNPAPVQRPEDPRPAVRRRRHGLRRLGDDHIHLENRPILPGRVRPHAAPRRRATENNILMQDRAEGANRPAAPQRAQSLVPALQELEDNARQLGEIGNIHLPPSLVNQLGPLESPPLQRGVFDDVGYIRRTIEERNRTPSVLNEDISSTVPELGSRTSSPPPNIGASRTEQQQLDDSNVPVSSATPFSEGRFAQSEFTFRSNRQFTEPESISEDAIHERPGNADNGWESDLADEFIQTPPTSSNTSMQVNPSTSPQPDVAEAQDDVASDSNADENDTNEQPVPEEPDGFLNRLSKWLWHTDGYVPGERPQQDADVTEIVADINAQAPFVPVQNQARDAQPAANPPPAQAAEPNIQQGVNINDPNAVDEAEDLEGILELIGMEGPIAGMIQNIIFSVFLITLTLSASVWCPYIWGKITLLFIAHPFSVFIKAPIFLLSKTADFIIDIGLFSFGVLGLLLNNLAKVVKVAMFPMSPRLSRLLNIELLGRLSSNLSQNSGSRLEKSIAKTILGFRPDLPTFSIQSHHVLRVFTRYIKELGSELIFKLASSITELTTTSNWHYWFTITVYIGKATTQLPTSSRSIISAFRQWSAQLQQDLRPLSFADPKNIDLTLVQWSASEKVVCILLGYTLFALAGSVYLNIARWTMGLKEKEKVPGVLADTLRQAGGVLKVVIIIGIEMIVFPLYCGTMLDFALLPLFEDATLLSRLQFFIDTPFTALFIHWFMGTCYMFHFALFVSMCRKTMRKGVLYFIRDPDDPSFHPVRDVLERPVATQLGKIAFSAFVYGSLLIICLGGVVTGLSRLGDVLPVRWGARDPLMVIPGDIIFYNFMLPFILRKIDLSNKISIVFEWWFRACAAGLRLSDFMFAVDNEDEKRPGAFLWGRFFKVLFHGEDVPVHPMVQFVEELASHREHLLWFESKEGGVDDALVHKMVGPSVKFKIINLFDDKSQALVQFNEEENMENINRIIDVENAKPDNKCHVKQVKDMKVESVKIPPLRNTRIDTVAGSYVRAPAKDSVRVPKGTNVFLQVDEKNQRLDGKPEPDTGLHSKKDDRFSRIYIPNHFRARILTFIAFVWTFVAVAGLAFTVGPLVIGRTVVRHLAGRAEVNDLHAVTAGLHAFAAFIFAAYYIKTRWSSGLEKIKNLLKNTRQALPTVLNTATQIAGLVYLSITVGFVMPMALSLLAELYVNIPMYMWLVGEQTDSPTNPLISSTQGTATPVVHLLQTWAMGILYLRVLIRILTTTPDSNTRAAVAIRGIVRRGLLRPDVRLASRALVLPVLTVSIILLGLPPIVTRSAIASNPRTLDQDEEARLYRYSYPVLLSAFIMIYAMRRLRTRIEEWRIKIRDEVYLIGERLHNFPSQEELKGRKTGRKQRTSSKGKEKESLIQPTSANQDAAAQAFYEELPGQNPTSPPQNVESNAFVVDDTEFDHVPWDWTHGQVHERSEKAEQSSSQAETSKKDEGGGNAIQEGALEESVQDFKTMTGLEALPSVDEIGDLGREVFRAEAEEGQA